MMRILIIVTFMVFQSRLAMLRLFNQALPGIASRKLEYQPSTINTNLVLLGIAGSCSTIHFNTSQALPAYTRREADPAIRELMLQTSIRYPVSP